MESLFNSVDTTGISVKVMLITPEMAQEFLTHNISNRKLNERTVRLYMKLLKEGKFLLSNDAICFNKNGDLLNGQHRLTACCKTGISMYCTVCRGMPQNSVSAMDNGKTRSAADILYLQEVKNASLTAAAVRRFMMLECGNVSISVDTKNGGGRQRFSNIEIEDEYKKRPLLWDEMCSWAKRLSNKSRWRLLTASDIAGVTAFLVLIKAHAMDVARAFFEEVEGVNPPTNNTIPLLQRRLNDSKRNATKRLSGFAAQKLLIKAWNAYITGKEYSNFQYQPRYDKDIEFV